jgi:hypothetical protein
MIENTHQVKKFDHFSDLFLTLKNSVQKLVNNRSLAIKPKERAYFLLQIGIVARF